MTLEEKQALQTLLIDEVQARLQDKPTLLIDALLSGNGFALVHHILTGRMAQAQDATRTFSHLLKAMQVFQQPSPTDEAAA